MAGSTKTDSRSNERVGRHPGAERALSTGGSHIGAVHIGLARSILTLQEGLQPTRERIDRWLKEQFVFREGQITDSLFPALFEAAALQAFPEQAETILKLHACALDIAHLRRNAKTLRPREDVRDHLLRDEVPQLIAVVQEWREHISDVKQDARQANVYLRLANILYYEVQMLWLDLQDAFTRASSALELQKDKSAFTETLDLGCQHAIENFRQQVQAYCALADVPLPRAFQKAKLKFGIRALDGEKHKEAEILLMQDT